MMNYGLQPGDIVDFTQLENKKMVKRRVYVVKETKDQIYVEIRMMSVVFQYMIDKMDLISGKKIIELVHGSG